jgi:branched-chain amino acid transport system ATP-binding protein
MGMTADQQPLLSCKDVSKRFGALAAVSHLSFDVTRGEVLGIGGPNGAGKTTLFEVISGLSPASEGQILLDGLDITRLAPHEICHRGVARLFQLNASFDGLTVLENVLVGAYFGQQSRLLPGLRIDNASRRHALDLLDLVGLADKAHQPMRLATILDRKLVMLAGALATKPKLLLMDEPVGGLTPKEIDHVAKVVRQLPQLDVTVLLIEHVMRFLTELSDRVLIMHHGERLFEGAPDQLAHDPTVVSVYLGLTAATAMQQAGKPGASA